MASKAPSGDAWNLSKPLPNSTLPERVLDDERQAAAFLGCCPRTVRTLADKGEFPRVRILSSVKYDRADLIAFIERSKVRTAAYSGAASEIRPAKEGE